jgi:ribosomal protein L11 methyltransferase
MPWQSITLELSEGEAEALSEALLEAGAVSVAIEDALADTAEEVARYAEPEWDAPVGWQRTRLEVLLAQDAEVDDVLRDAARAAGVGHLPVPQRRCIDDTDWVRRCEAQFAPLAVGSRLWIVPSWHDAPAAGSAAILRIDPGLAFGTGSHPTTRLVLAWLAQSLTLTHDAVRSQRVLDYGCGSGILAIAAGKLGASPVDAVDTDPQALIATRENAQRNAVALRALLPDELPAGEYDMVVANILADPLIRLAPLFAARVRSAGRLALSGLLECQADEVIAAYASAFDARIVAREDGWVLIEATRQ